MEADNSIFRPLERFDFSITGVVMASTFLPQRDPPKPWRRRATLGQKNRLRVRLLQ
jgi:hypothetical protein